MADIEAVVIEIVAHALVFMFLFILGGAIAAASLPEFPGRFFLGGMLVGIFGTGAGSLVIHAVIRNR